MAALGWYIDADLQDYLLEISRAAPLTAEAERLLGSSGVTHSCGIVMCHLAARAVLARAGQRQPAFHTDV